MLLLSGPLNCREIEINLLDSKLAELKQETALNLSTRCQHNITEQVRFHTHTNNTQ